MIKIYFNKNRKHANLCKRCVATKCPTRRHDGSGSRRCDIRVLESRTAKIRFVRRKFCLGHPDDCRLTSRGEEVCEQFPERCQNMSFKVYYMVPELESLENEGAIFSIGETRRMGVEPEDLIKSCHISWAPEEDFCSRDKLEITHTFGVFDISSACFVVNSRVRRPPSAVSHFPLTSTDKGNYIEMVLDLQPFEQFQPSRGVEGILFIDNPFEFNSAFVGGKAIYPGNSYVASLQPIVTELLSEPYATNCTDHVEKRRLSSRLEDRSEQMCENMCKIRLALSSCDCFPLSQTIYSEFIGDDDPLCQKSTDPDLCINKLNVSTCYTECPKECRRLSYDIFFSESVFENPPEHQGEYRDEEYGPHNIGLEEGDREAYFNPLKLSNPLYAPMFGKQRYVKIKIQMKSNELWIYRQKPKFESVELFGFIGGYLGIWLGLSVLETVQLAETFLDRIQQHALP